MWLLSLIQDTLGDTGALTTGNPIGDITSYTVAAAIIAAAWRLFRWYRADAILTDHDHQDKTDKFYRNQLMLLGYITELSILAAKAGLEVPKLPDLEL
jgi:hypothetical protein